MTVDNAAKIPWYEGKTKVWLALFLIWPLGFYGLCKSSVFSKKEKYIISSAFLSVVIIFPMVAMFIYYSFTTPEERTLHRLQSKWSESKSKEAALEIVKRFKDNASPNISALIKEIYNDDLKADKKLTERQSDLRYPCATWMLLNNNQIHPVCAEAFNTNKGIEITSPVNSPQTPQKADDQITIPLAENSCKKVYELYNTECVGQPKSEVTAFSRVGMGNFDYYSNTINQNMFWVYCKQTSDKPVEFSAFEKDVCIKTAK